MKSVKAYAIVNDGHVHSVHKTKEQAKLAMKVENHPHYFSIVKLTGDLPTVLKGRFE